MAVEEPKSDEQMAMLMQQVRDMDMQKRRQAIQLGGAIGGRAAYRQGGATFAQLQQFAPMPGNFMPADMAKFNKPLLDAYNELTAAQAAVGANEEEQMKQRIIFHKAAMAEGVKLLNKKRDVATEVEKKRIDKQIEQAKEHIDALDKMEGVTGTSAGITDYDRGRAAAGAVISRTAKDGGKIDEGVVIGKVAGLRSRDAIESFKENLREQYMAAYGADMDVKFDDPEGEFRDTLAQIDATADKLEAEGKLRPSSAAGLSQELDPEGNPYLGPGGAQGREAILTLMAQNIEDLNAATGGQLNTEMQQIAAASSGGRTNDIMKAADLVVNRGLTSPEDKQKYLTDLNEQKASVLGQMLRPGASPEHKKMYAALTQSEAFQKGKKAAGLVTDEAFVRHLRHGYRTQAREGRVQDRATLAKLNQGRKPATGPQASAMNALAATVKRKAFPKRDGAAVVHTPDPVPVTETTEEIA
jgi:hypothetical protein